VTAAQGAVPGDLVPTPPAEDSQVDPSDDLALLRAFEPVIQYTAGELFYPMATDAYVATCDLFATTPAGETVQLATPGELTLERLATIEIPTGSTPFLRYVQRPMNGVELAAWQRRPDRVRFRAPGRLARVGLFARLVDAGFNASLVIRGSVPGGTAARASEKYQAVRSVDPRIVYHGRVVRRDGWIVLHYLYFYAMNDWRSTFAGANDHEADLEQAFVVLEDRGDAAPRPVWLGCAAHDYVGDELRRRWDDPALVKVGDHPVIHAGAGSHAAYFEPGEYLTTVPLPALRGVRGFLEWVRETWHDTLRQSDPGDIAAAFENALAIPFIDYARGDGLAVGPGGGAEWTPIVVNDALPWVDGYKGLWGLDTRDRFAGERAPAGLKYTRAGTVRQSWADPLGFLGLDKLPPPSRVPAALQQRIVDLEAERDAVMAEADAKASELRKLALDVRVSEAAQPTPEAVALQERVHAEEKALAALRARVPTIDADITALLTALSRVEAGDFGPPDAHLRHPHRPQPPLQHRYGRAVEAWAAISASVMLLVLVGLLYTGVVPWWAALALVIGGYVLVEAVFRRRLTDLLLRVTVALAIVGAIILAVAFAQELVIAAIIGIAILTLIENLRELRA
jgi:hypothetical protein